MFFISTPPSKDTASFGMTPLKEKVGGTESLTELYKRHGAGISFKTLPPSPSQRSCSSLAFWQLQFQLGVSSLKCDFFVVI